jgi:H+-transporting ATPase
MGKVEIFGIESSYEGTGLHESDIQARRQQYGYNEIPEKHVGPFIGTLKRMWGPIPWLLEAAMVFELFLGKIPQAIVVFLLLVFSALIGEVQELRAKKALGFLHQKLQISIRTLRNGTWITLPSRELVPGDIVHVRVGDIVAADMEIVSGTVSVDESSLTGESVDVTKGIADTIFSASTITHGEAIARVTAIGTKSSYGKTAELVRTAEAPGRLQTLLFKIVRYLAYLDIILAVILIITAFVNGTPWQELLPFTVILFIATIPISMPSSFVVANSVEAKNLAQQHVLVTGLTGIQEAASMNVLLVDKTGTLTNNRPEIARLIPYDNLEETALLQLAASASDHTSSDSISAAIIEACRNQKVNMLERISFTPFDPAHKLSKAQIIQNGAPLNVAMGSPLVMAEIAEIPSNFSEQVDTLSAGGARVLAIASGENDKLICRGLIALADSPRSDAKESIAKIKEMSIRVIMVTGDTISTAKAIAREVGIGDRIGTLKDALSNPRNLMDCECLS